MFENITLITEIILIITASLNLTAFYSRDLMMLQQNSYRNERYLKWFSQSGESTNINRIICCIGLFFILIQRVPFYATAVICIVITAWQFAALLTKKYKKPLVWTPRAKRIFGVMVALTAVIGVAIGFFAGLKAVCLALMAFLIVSPLILLISNDILKPVEKHINSKYYNEAAKILASMPDLKIIGITGSYGKTSTKHYLNRILQEHYSTMMTPGSFNTTMGVIRTIREYLQPYNEVFIVEMGAKQKGDIKEICDLVHPTMGIITAVGPQHLESFKTIENVQATKFELADAIPAEGVVVVNNDFAAIADRKVNNTTCLRYAVDNRSKADFTATDITYTPAGTTFVINGKGISEPITFHTKLVGACNVSNLLAAVIIALKLQVPVDKIKYAIERIEQVEHRLNMKRTPGGVTIIDDAFNSNPQGARMALDVLAMMTTGKRIIVTPGMIELGDLQEKANEEFGRHMADCADVAIVVGNYNRNAILSGLAACNFKQENIHVADTFADAQKYLQTILKSGDVVLYENDLPDTFK